MDITDPAPPFDGGHSISACPVLDVNIAALDMPAALAAIDRLRLDQLCHTIHLVAVDSLNWSQRSTGAKQSLQSASLCIPDSVGVTWAMRHLHGVSAPRLPGSDLLEAVVQHAAPGTRHAFVGSTPDTLGALRRELTGIRTDVIITDMFSPPFRDIDAAAVDSDLEQLTGDTDILWVGLGTPRQLHWAELARKRGAAPVIISVGAAFDFVAGTKRRAPKPVRRFGLEWLWRLVSEPRRLWHRYLVGNPQFVLAVARDRRTVSSEPPAT